MISGVTLSYCQFGLGTLCLVWIYLVCWGTLGLVGSLSLVGYSKFGWGILIFVGVRLMGVTPVCLGFPQFGGVPYVSWGNPLFGGGTLGLV